MSFLWRVANVKKNICKCGMHGCLGWGIDEGSEFMPGFAVGIGGLDEGGAVTDLVMAVGGDDDVHGVSSFCLRKLVNNRVK